MPAFAAPKRIVSTFLCTDEYVFRLAPRGSIVALSSAALDDRPVVSTIFTAAQGMRAIHPDTETVLNLRPDLVVMYAGVNPRLRANLERLKVPLLEIAWANTLADIRTITRQVGESLGASGKAEAMLSAMDRKLAEAAARAPHPAITALLYQPNGYVGGGTYVDEIMRAAGLENLAPTVKPNRAGVLSVETVVATAPALLILGGDGSRDGAFAYRIQRHPGLKALRGRTRIAPASLNALLCPGPWSANAAETFADLADGPRTLARPGARR